jgi:polar amino acid transport system substrate-binding protein
MRKGMNLLCLAWVLGLSACAPWSAAPTAPTVSNAPSSALALSLSAAELAQARQALAPSGTLRVGVYPGSPTSLVIHPQTGERTGVTLALGQLMGQQLGVPVQVLEFPRVAEIITALQRGEVDMTFTNASPARARDVDFSRTLLQLELGLLLPPQSSISRFEQADRAGLRVGVSQGSSSQGVLTQQFKQAQVVPVASLEVAQQMLRSQQLDAFATNKGILFEMREKLPGFTISDDRWGLENLAIAVPKGRTAGQAFLNALAEQVTRSGRLAHMAQRAGLRGLAKAD